MGHPSKSIPAGFDVDLLLHFGETAYIDLVGPRNPPDGDSRNPNAFFERPEPIDLPKVGCHDLGGRSCRSNN
jgi:hypothetical protein